MKAEGLKISGPLRAWLVVEVCFGLAAIAAVGLAPADTQTNFAWPIKPVVMAAVLGAFYISTAPVFLLMLLARRWEMVRVMVLPGVIFTTVLLLVTFVHWDKFLVSSIPFYVWFASYILPPPIFLWAYLWHQRRAALSSPPRDPLPLWLYRTLLVCGGLITLVALLGLFFPQLLMANFAWRLTPLTTRSLCGWLMAVGTLLLSMVHENDRTRVRLATPMLILLLPALLVQMARYSSQVNWSNPMLWVGLGFFALIGLCGLYLANGSWRNALR